MTNKQNKLKYNIRINKNINKQMFKWIVNMYKQLNYKKSYK